MAHFVIVQAHQTATAVKGFLPPIAGNYRQYRRLKCHGPALLAGQDDSNRDTRIPSEPASFALDVHDAPGLRFRLSRP